MKNKVIWHRTLLLFGALLIASCNKDDTTTPLTPVVPSFDWEGEVGKFNEAYRDSVLFSSDRAIGTSFVPSVHLMYKDGTGMRAATHEWFTFAACWSPRKWKVFYVADTTFSGRPARSLNIMNADGSGRRRLTPPSDDVWGVACAPNGKKIAFILLNSRGEGKIRVSNPDGTNGQDITGYFGANSFHTLTWSNDSQQLAYDGASNGIGIVNVDGTNNKSLFTWNYQCWEPDWSPDGKKVAFVTFARRDSNYYSNLFYFDILTSSVHQITSTNTFDSRPEWTPDGSKIMFSSAPPGLPGTVANNIFFVNIDGTGKTQITSGMFSDGDACW